MTPDLDRFPTEVEGLPAASAPEVVEIPDGGSYDLRIAPVAKRLGDATVRMLAYNGSIPGPTLRVREGSEIAVCIRNEGDLETTVHWHGLRVENRYDGTHETQRPIAVGETFTARVRAPDPGLYWYHPHIRQDYTVEAGLHGNLIVDPADPGYWPAVHRDVVLTLDDVLLEDGQVAPFSLREPTHAAMGRFGNVLLAGGRTDLSLRFGRGAVVRFLLTNTANTRVFRVALPGARMKLVGGDSGRVEREQLVEDVLVAPSERAIVDVLFDRPGELTLEHRPPGGVHRLARIQVGDEPVEPSLEERFGELRTSEEMVAERERSARFLDAEPDRVLAFLAEMDMAGHEGQPPHEEHDTHAHEPEASGVHAHGADRAGEGIEWEDDMPEMNRMTTPATMRWKIVDRETGAENEAIDWRLRVGDRIKIRILNEMAGDHPMHHPFHVHGAGRFLVLSRDGAPERNLVWKDSVLVRTGETVDLLLDVTEPGRWMAHCHIAEHHETGMAFSFDVSP